MKPSHVLFVCIHNSARSQMAEAFLNLHGQGRFKAVSAGFTPGNINPLVIEVMKEKGIDLTGKETHSVFDFFKQGLLFAYVITVCDESSAEQCPIFPGICQRLHWSFADPSSLVGTRTELLEEIRGIRDRIEQKIISWTASFENQETV
jgi:arsenate reductase